MTIKLGLHMCGWGDRPVPDVLVAARELGYDGVELAPAWLLGRDIGAIAAPEESAVVQEVAEWIGAPDSTQLVLAASKGPPTWQGELDEVRRRLDALVAGLRSSAADEARK